MKKSPAASFLFDPCPNGSLKRSFAWPCATDTVFDLRRNLANQMALITKAFETRLPIDLLLSTGDKST